MKINTKNSILCILILASIFCIAAVTKQQQPAHSVITQSYFFSTQNADVARQQIRKDIVQYRTKGYKVANTITATYGSESWTYSDVIIVFEK
jgi:hypothetical protein